MPSARRASGDTLAAEDAPTPACLTRYEYPQVGVTIDCHTTLVGGDPHHYVTTCPAGVTPRSSYAYPPDLDEVELDAGGRVAHERVVSSDPRSRHALEDKVNVYDADGRLQESTVTDGAGTVYRHTVVVDRDAAGRPLTATATVEPIVVYVSYPETTQIASSYGYDALGRLNRVQHVYTVIDWLYYDRTITYDDVARQRNYLTIVDDSAVIPELGPATNPEYDLLDVDGHVLEYGNELTGNYVDYRYDEQGRVVSEVASGQREARTVSYVYDCP